MSTIAQNSHFTRPSLSDTARRLCEADERGLECDEPLPHIKRDPADGTSADDTNLPESHLYNEPPIGPTKPTEHKD